VVLAVKAMVTVHVGLHWLLVKLAATPVGRPDAENVRGVVVPETRVAVIEELGLVLASTTVRLLGEGVDRLKSNVGGGGAVTSMVMVVGVVATPKGVAVTLTVYDPLATELATLIVKLLIAPEIDGVREIGPKDMHEMPEGRGVMHDSVTAWPMPEFNFAVTATLPVMPC
jgi:hypothetical protein